MLVAQEGQELELESTLQCKSDGNIEDLDDVEYVEVQEKGILFKIPCYYKIQTVLGNGGYGFVVGAKDDQNDEIVAIKKIPDVFSHGVEYATRILREIKILKHLRMHENIVALRNLVKPKSLKDFNDVYLVTEYMDDTLRNFCLNQVEFSDQHVQFIIYQLLSALKFMHSANIIHRDIKPQNILINYDCRIKLCDFGLSRNIDEQNPHMSSYYISTRWYRAPELLLCSKEAGKPMDIWSVGCVFAELLLYNSRSPHKPQALFPGKNFLHQLELILEFCGTPDNEDVKGSSAAISFLKSRPKCKPKDIHALFPKTNPHALDLLSRMLHFNPNKRITVDEALNHPYLESMHDSDDEPVCDQKFHFNIDLSKNSVTIEHIKRMIYSEIMEWNEKEQLDAIFDFC